MVVINVKFVYLSLLVFANLFVSIIYLYTLVLHEMKNQHLLHSVYLFISVYFSWYRRNLVQAPLSSDFNHLKPDGCYLCHEAARSKTQLSGHRIYVCFVRFADYSIQNIRRLILQCGVVHSATVVQPKPVSWMTTVG